MDTAFRYWQLIRLDGSGQCQVHTLVPVQTWLQATCADLLADATTPDDALQQRLHPLAQTDPAHPAALSLRCYISHQSQRVCIRLAQQFGDTYGFTAEDLYPLVLDDDGQPPDRPTNQTAPAYHPLSLTILASFDPAKAQLSTWATRLIKTHPDLDRALLERGLYRVSDWAILNDTTPDQLDRIWRHYHLCSAAEVAQAQTLLSQYHQVYRQDRLRQRRSRGGKCQPPTPEQLSRIDPQRSPRTVLADLKAMAAQLRQYRIHARNGHPIPYGAEPAWDAMAPADAGDPAAEQDAFLETYRQVLHTSLEQVLVQVLQGAIAKHQQKQPPRAAAYVRGLYLFHCEGQAMGKLAAQIGLTSQVQVNRLLQLKRLRAEVRQQLIPQLQQCLATAALDYISADRLRHIDHTLAQVLSERVDDLMADAAREAQIPKGRTADSLFSRQLCQTLHQFMA